ncbi:helix-turn-helix transcriptional regulator [Halomonas organivorans]|uniref:Transcriptional regulator with XRE-family HTH domain n=1 Tax=Halomonas organivorans TaxID=257772 RepID=A0A7W5G779_9GAMM|nr:helix-turn-helix transcriptional regulator [Halomonas organivorans]MBB3143343.1 transcriptional regulator with XRE-family HTH domain [Halomonas organivorans]
MHDDFAANLRLLCSYYRSIAEVCRRLDINRAQFNRYLSGRYKPADHTMRRICDFFGVEVHEILLPHEDFQPLVRLRPEEREAPVRQATSPGIPAGLLDKGRQGMSRYLGCYHEYYLAMSQPGQVLCTLVCLERHGDDILYQRTERMPPIAGGRSCHNRYRGMALLLTDRLFLVDHESLNGHEITQTILFPSFKSHVSRLTGLKLGVADSSERMPCCVRVLYERLPDTLGPRQALARCGLYPLDDPSLDPQIVAAIRNDVSPNEWQFRARYP